MPPLAHTGFSQPRGDHCHPSRWFIWDKVPSCQPEGALCGWCWVPGGQEPVGSARAGNSWAVSSFGALGWFPVLSQDCHRFEETELAHSEQSSFGTFAMSTVSPTWLQGTYDVFSGAAGGSCWVFYKVFLGLGFSCTQNPTDITEHSNEISYLLHFTSSQEFLLFFL